MRATEPSADLNNLTAIIDAVAELPCSGDGDGLGGDNNDDGSASLPVTVVTPTISVTNTIENINAGDATADPAFAANNDELAFEIAVRNTSSVTAENVVLRHTLPSTNTFLMRQPEPSRAHWRSVWVVVSIMVLMSKLF